MQNDPALSSIPWHQRARTLAGAFKPTISRSERIHAVAEAFKQNPRPHLLARQKKLSKDTIEEFAAFVRANYIHPPSYWETPSGQQDLQGLAGDRLAGHRKTYIPWLDSIQPLKGLRILEIGCGTGSSTVALAEQGAEVTGIEVEEAALTVACQLCKLYDVQAQFLCMNATDAHESLDISSYDLVIFFAVLEHMTPNECLSSLDLYWRKMRPGALLGVIETPNRLWFYDDHTSWLPFFHWLPSEIAIRYCSASPRPAIADLHKDTSVLGNFGLQRWGRGISFHEFELAIGPVTELPIVSSLGPWLRRRDIEAAAYWVKREYPYQKMLRRVARDVPASRFGVARDIPACWFESYINIVIRRADTKSPPMTPPSAFAM